MPTTNTHIGTVYREEKLNLVVAGGTGAVPARASERFRDRDLPRR
jgi:hypothetical protein